MAVIEAKRLRRGVGVEEPARQGRAEGVERGERRCDRGPDPWPERQVLRVQVDAVEAGRRRKRRTRQGTVGAAEHRADQPPLLLGPAVELVARHVAEEREHVALHRHDGPSVGGGHRRTGRDAAGLDQGRDRQASLEAYPIGQRHGLGDPAPRAERDQPGPGVHAAVVR